MTKRTARTLRRMDSCDPESFMSDFSPAHARKQVRFHTYTKSGKPLRLRVRDVARAMSVIRERLAEEANRDRRTAVSTNAEPRVVASSPYSATVLHDPRVLRALRARQSFVARLRAGS